MFNEPVAKEHRKWFKRVGLPWHFDVEQHLGFCHMTGSLTKYFAFDFTSLRISQIEDGEDTIY